MLTKNHVIKCIAMFVTNFQIKIGEKDLEQYTKLLLNILPRSGVDDDMFGNAMLTFIQKTEGSNYNKLPSVGDILAILNLKPKDVEQIAQENAQQCMSAATEMRCASLVQIDCPVSNWVIQNAFGGVAHFCWQLDPTNKNRPEDIWVKKRFIEEYITAHTRGAQILNPIRNLNHRVESWKDVLTIGDKTKCENNMQLAIERKQALLANPQAQKMQAVLDDLTKKKEK